MSSTAEPTSRSEGVEEFPPPLERMAIGIAERARGEIIPLVSGSCHIHAYSLGAGERLGPF